MNQPVQFSENLLKELREMVLAQEPKLKSERGELFVSNVSPASALKLSMATENYLAFINSIPEDKRPNNFHLIPVENQSFQIVINAPVYFEDGKTFIDGKEIIIL